MPHLNLGHPVGLRIRLDGALGVEVRCVLLQVDSQGFRGERDHRSTGRLFVVLRFLSDRVLSEA